ncbi:MFS transporter [Candidatus Nucleicultrix amoebiphila]|jgi:MFS family permease|uniref:Lysosomal dipeptide transporter MFSD1 n=1 Tax=Candidatus Nucleicultrix amoebiphila FS5 TaxID=1414854 RepID=A0A1W6N311_9PROT|nr:MFS transporter [Candidatus Nucleicultrix amoebiphila]ARN84169.1 hypothetical protein GQ61_01100 [Candidatus Nucleicultrix amoebiphila FS5]
MKTLKLNANTRTTYYLAWFIISLFYLYQYILRVSPGIMVVELREIFKLTAEQFSSLGAIYLYAYSFLQVPLGFILDRIGVKKVIAFSIFLCLLGTLLFAFSTHVWMLQFARFLIGIGSAPAFICALKIVSDHVPLKMRGLLMGATLSLGTIGALLSGKVLVKLIDGFGWKNSLFLCVVLGLFLLLIVMIFVPSWRYREGVKSNSLMDLTRGIGAVLKKREIVLYSLIAISVYTPLCVIADLWGTAFLMQKFSLARAEAAQITLSMYGGLTIGSLLLPWISLKWHVLKGSILVSAIGLFLALIILLYTDLLSITGLVILLTLIGILCGAEMVCFAGAAQYTSAKDSGLALGVVNTLNMLGGAMIQQIIGWYLDYKWQGNYGIDGARSYGTDELTTAFMILPIIILLSGLLTFKLPKTKKIKEDMEVKDASTYVHG